MHETKQVGWSPAPLSRRQASPDCDPSADVARILAELSPPRADDGVAVSAVLPAMRQPAATMAAAQLVAELVGAINDDLRMASREVSPIVEFGVTLNGDEAARTAARDAFDHAGVRGSELEHVLRDVAATGAAPDATGSLEESARLYASAISDALDTASPGRIGGHRRTRLLRPDRLHALTGAHRSARHLVAGAAFVDANLSSADRRSGDAGAGTSNVSNLAGTPRGSGHVLPVAELARELGTYFDRSARTTSLLRLEIQRLRPYVHAQEADRVALAFATAGTSELVRSPADPEELQRAGDILSHCAGVARFAVADLVVVVIEDETTAFTRSLAVAERRMANAAHVAEVAQTWAEQHHELLTGAAKIIRDAGGSRHYRTASFNVAADKLMGIAAQSDRRTAEARLLVTMIKAKVTEILETARA